MSWDKKMQIGDTTPNANLSESENHWKSPADIGKRSCCYLKRLKVSTATASRGRVAAPDIVLCTCALLAAVQLSWLLHRNVLQHLRDHWEEMTRVHIWVNIYTYLPLSLYICMNQWRSSYEFMLWSICRGIIIAVMCLLCASWGEPKTAVLRRPSLTML